MYYVAKMYNHMVPSIVMNFEKQEHAEEYADLMNKACKGTYIVLKPLEKYVTLNNNQYENI